MSAGATAYLVVRLPEGFGDVFPLTPGQRYTLGRATTNDIVLNKDELCSREHAEVYNADGRWWLCDLNSLNGTLVNKEKLDGEWELSDKDEIHLGRTDLVYVEDMDDLPPLLPQPRRPDDSVAIKARLGNTRFLTPPPPTKDGMAAEPVGQRRSLSRDLALLYRLALDMGSAGSYDELVRMVLDSLLEAIPADVGAILAVKDGRDLEVTAYRHRDPSVHAYHRISERVSLDVLTSREAILAEDVKSDRHLSNQESLADLGTTSLICAPVMFGERVLGLIHLYCTDGRNKLDDEDLEFAMAVAKALGTAVHQLQKQDSLSAENRFLRDQLRIESELVGDSPAVKEIERQVGQVAGTNATVLIRGESGVGKELVARAIHYSSLRKDAPFVCLNCAALTETLLESELFGHEKGAFTGATEKKIGKFEAADRGTIFLDEIGEMSPKTQTKFLRVLEEKKVERVGGNLPIPVDVRVVAATNQPLEQAVRDGRFRTDLFYRLQVVEIRVQPLRDRLSDVAKLARHFLARFVRETGRKVRGFTPAALQKMEQYAWPGNVRELRNVVERAVALSTGPMLDAADIWLSSLEVNSPAAPAPAEPAYQPISLDDVEKEHILRTLNHTDWNKSKAAEILHIERSTLDRKIGKYDLKRSP